MITKKLDNILFILGLILAGILLFFVTDVFAKDEPKKPKTIIIRETNIIKSEAKDQYKAGVEFRIVDTKNISWAVYYNRDFNNDNNEIGIKIIIKLGKSYEEKEIKKLNKKLKQIEKAIKNGQVF